MRFICLLLAVLSLTACDTKTVSVMLDQDQHALTVRLDRDTFWSDEATLRVIMSRLPECQRQHILGPVWLEGLRIELRDDGDNGVILMADDQAWKIDNSSCEISELRDAHDVDGTPLGTIRFDRDQRLVLVPAA